MLGAVVSSSLALTVGTWRSSLRRRCADTATIQSLLIDRLLSLLGELGEKFQESEEKLALFRSEIVTELLQLLHVLLDLFSFLVAGKLDLIDSFKHMSLALLSCLELADVERVTSEWSLGRFDPSSLSIFNALVANKSEAKHGVIWLRFCTFVGLSGKHELDVADFTEGGKELSQLFLCLLDGDRRIDREATEVKVLSGHLLLVLEGAHADVGFSEFSLESRDNVELWSWQVMRDRIIDTTLAA